MKQEMEDIEQQMRQRGYILIDEIGNGGQATIYLVQRTESGMKQIDRAMSYLACKVGIGPALKREALLLKQLSHPSIPRFVDWWECGVGSFLVMEYVQGQSLEQYIRTEQILMKDMESWSIQLAEVILALHRLPMTWIYRDIKPANIVIRTDGRLKLVDFGCACPLTEVGWSRAGTWGYAAPEQLIAPELVDEASDLYSYGRLLERLLRKCRIHNMGEWIRFVRWKRVCRSCISGKMDRRPDSVQQILRSVQKYEKS